MGRRETAAAAESTGLDDQQQAQAVEQILAMLRQDLVDAQRIDAAKVT